MALGRYAIIVFSQLFLFNNHATAQYTCRIIATVPKSDDDIFVAGSFNNWQPGDANYKLSLLNRQRQLVISNLAPGTYEFKFNRGKIENNECDAYGVNIGSRHILLTKDTTILCNIQAWSDAYFDLRNLPDTSLYDATLARAAYYVEINLDSSYKYATALYKLAEKLHSPIKEALALDVQGVIFTRQGNGEKALELLYKSIEIKKLVHDSSGIAFTYYSIGKLYEGFQDVIKARNNYQSSIEWTEQAYAYMASVPLTNIGNLFLNENKTDSAMAYAARAVKANSNSVDALLLRGDIEKANRKYNTALGYYKKAIVAAALQSPGSPLFNNNAVTYQKMAGVYYYMGLKDSAFYYADTAYAISVRLNNPGLMISTGSVLSGLFEKEKRFDSAYFYQKIIMQKKDSLFTIEKEKQVHNIFFLEKLRFKDAEALADRNLATTKIYVLAGFITLLIVIGFSYRSTLKRRFKKRIAEIEMRALRAQMNPHFIFNCLASINRYIVICDTKTASAYLTKFSKLIRLILDNSANEFVSIDAEILTLKLYLDMESLRFDNCFNYSITYDDLERTDNTAIPTMIIQPYIENAIWHGLLHKDEKGTLAIRFSKVNEDSLMVEIEDNGVGRKQAAANKSKDALKTKSYGMQISKDRIAIINAQHKMLSSINIKDMEDAEGNGTGTKVTLFLPLIEMAAGAQKTKK